MAHDLTCRSRTHRGAVAHWGGVEGVCSSMYYVRFVFSSMYYVRFVFRSMYYVRFVFRYLLSILSLTPKPETRQHP